MEIYILVGEENRVIDWSSTSGDNRIKIEVEDDHEVIDNPYVFTYSDGILTKDIPYQQLLIKLDQEKSKQPTINDLISQIQNNLMTADEKYKRINLLTVTLTDLKNAKLLQLEEICNKSIIDGFDFTINSISYRFSCSITAQSNFQGSDALFKDGLITSAEWTVTNNTTGAIERIMLDQPIFNQIKLKVFEHISSNIKKLRNILQPLVESALTVEDVNRINW
ncbi:hypothetical protein [Bacillus xiapuensis]|uniref:DUF4376 domain-containing protein n=1 Tax=Bacillus xiapuensis TaxID=2014075 RepID=A0ABU6N7N3_9BACI|nr:hypothetical protein [Bacillus xiapuensis]